MRDHADNRQSHIPQPSARLDEALASKLHAQHDAIMQQLNALDQQTRTPDGDDAQLRDGAHEVDMTLAKIAQIELNQIDQAHLQVSSLDYGVCVNCGAEIPLTRLQAKPQASRCLECQAQLEQRSLAQW